MTAHYYRSRPVTVEAMQYTVATCPSLHQWLGYQHEPLSGGLCGRADLTIETSSGPLRARPGDWLVRGEGGTFAVFAADEFAERFELIS